MNNDTCRCHDTQCPKRETCWRFVHRYDKREWICHCMTLCEPGDNCQFYIPVKEEQ
jgi:hypothetical protein